MDERTCAYRGCLLGMAVGDALGYSIDEKTWQEICESYGPNGLLGFDLQSQDFATITSYTQIAAYLCNGLLLGISRGKNDRMRYIKLALQEWTRSQQFYRDPEPSFCWLAKLPQFRRRHCRDARMLDNLRLQMYGTMENPRNDNNSPGALTSAIAVGMFYQPTRLSPEQVGPLAGQVIALTHGNPETFLAGVVLAYAITGILQEPEHDLQEQFSQAVAVMQGQFREQFPQADELAKQIKQTISRALQDRENLQKDMKTAQCLTAAQCLCGAIYACLTNPDDFDQAIVTAVNHSGLSAVVGAVTGAVMGAKLGEYALPDFYLESLDCAEALRLLADDIACGTPATELFDDDWDHRYVQGLPPEQAF